MLYDRPRVYELLFADRRDDVAFYRALARGVDRVLELGVGAGRVALPVARDGAVVTGVDASAAMLAALRERLASEPEDVRARILAHEGDMRTWRGDARFGLVTCPFNGVAHLHTADDFAAFFENVRAHLAPGGRFAFDAWLPDPALLRETSLESARFVHPDTGEAVTLREEFSYDAYAQVLSVRLTVTPVLRPEAREVLTLTQRQLFPEETLALLRAHGFDVRWRTSAFRPPPGEGARGDHLEPPDRRGALLAYVCAAR
ncbi:MAG: class I SAM-dependent methyltransferase [Polyangiales bacterium]